jgi:hypothetical protein
MEEGVGGAMEEGVGGAMEEGVGGAMEEGVGGAMEEGVGRAMGQGLGGAVDNDKSDVSSSFSDDSDADVPLNQLPPRTKELLKHPFPNPEKVSDRDAKLRPWKLNCIRHLILGNEWKNTVVEPVQTSKKYKGKPPILIRMDGLKFPLLLSKHKFLYVFYSEFGLELIHVEEILKNQDRGGMRVRYTRVLSTAEAEKHCRSETNHSWINDSGVSHEISLGAKALREILEKQEKRNDQRIIFHRGDFPFVTSVGNLVGFVQWETACDSVAGEFATSGERSLASLNTALSLDQRLRSLSDVDLVFLGPDFSDMNGN